MILLLIALFVLGAIVMMTRIGFGMSSAELMPYACPSCYDGGLTALTGPPAGWYYRDDRSQLRCRYCHAVLTPQRAP